MRIRSMLLFGVLAYGVGLLVTMPAAFALQWVNTEPVAIAGVQGTVWHGSAASVELPDLGVTDVTWKFLPQHLLYGELGIAVGLRYLGGPGDGRVLLDWRRELHLQSFTYQLAAERLVELLPLPLAEFGGEIDARIEQVTIGEGALQRVSGRLDWKRAELTAPFKTLLGDYRFNLTTTERGHQAVLQGSGGTLDADGALRVQPNGQFTADFKLRPQPGAPKELVEQLGFIARKQGNGSYLLRQRGSIEDYL